jgi:hypothetical protein
MGSSQMAIVTVLAGDVEAELAARAAVREARG